MQRTKRRSMWCWKIRAWLDATGAPSMVDACDGLAEVKKWIADPYDTCGTALRRIALSS